MAATGVKADLHKTRDGICRKMPSPKFNRLTMKYLVFAIGCTLLLSAFLFPKPIQTNREKHVSPAADPKDSGIKKIVRLAEAFKAGLNEEQLSQLQLEYSKKDAAKWSNFPAGFRNAGRVGLNFGSMTAEQTEAAKALIKEVAGTAANEGWDELQQIINADDYLKTHGGGNEYGAAHYYIAFLGTPAATGLFEIQFGGIRYSVVRLFKIVTAFTIGHSVTLLAGALGWLRLPAQPIEVLISFSILASAVHAIRPLFPGKEGWVAAGFGLVHGLAFATVLSNLELSGGKLALSIWVLTSALS